MKKILIFVISTTFVFGALGQVGGGGTGTITAGQIANINLVPKKVNKPVGVTQGFVPVVDATGNDVEYVEAHSGATANTQAEVTAGTATVNKYVQPDTLKVELDKKENKLDSTTFKTAGNENAIGINTTDDTLQKVANKINDFVLTIPSVLENVTLVDTDNLAELKAKEPTVTEDDLLFTFKKEDGTLTYIVTPLDKFIDTSAIKSIVWKGATESADAHKLKITNIQGTEIDLDLSRLLVPNRVYRDTKNYPVVPVAFTKYLYNPNKYTSLKIRLGIPFDNIDVSGEITVSGLYTNPIKFSYHGYIYKTTMNWYNPQFTRLTQLDDEHEITAKFIAGKDGYGYIIIKGSALGKDPRYSTVAVSIQAGLRGNEVTDEQLLDIDADYIEEDNLPATDVVIQTRTSNPIGGLLPKGTLSELTTGTDTTAKSFDSQTLFKGINQIISAHKYWDATVPTYGDGSVTTNRPDERMVIDPSDLQAYKAIVDKVTVGHQPKDFPLEWELVKTSGEERSISVTYGTLSTTIASTLPTGETVEAFLKHPLVIGEQPRTLTTRIKADMTLADVKTALNSTGQIEVRDVAGVSKSDPTVILKGFYQITNQSTNGESWLFDSMTNSVGSNGEYFDGGSVGQTNYSSGWSKLSIGAGDSAMSGFSLSGNVVTCLVAGRYSVYASLSIGDVANGQRGSGTSKLQMIIRKNGGNTKSEAWGNISTSKWQSQIGTKAVVDLAVGDTIDVAIGAYGTSAYTRASKLVITPVANQNEASGLEIAQTVADSASASEAKVTSEKAVRDLFETISLTYSTVPKPTGEKDERGEDIWYRDVNDSISNTGERLEIQTGIRRLKSIEGMIIANGGDAVPVTYNSGNGKVEYWISGKGELVDDIIGSREVPSTSLDKATLFAAPNGTGTGLTVDDPASLEDSMNKLKSGDVLFLRGGVYNLSMDGLKRFNVSKDGTEANPTIIESYPGETAVIDGSSLRRDVDEQRKQGSVRIMGDYIHVKKIKVTNMPEKGIYITGDHVVVEGCETSHNGLTGIFAYGVNDIVVQDNISHHNSDYGLGENKWNYDDGDNADGIALSHSNNSIVRNNIVYLNSDDGIDLWGSNNMLVYANKTYKHGFLDNGDHAGKGNGEGIKAGGVDTHDNVISHNLIWGNYSNGITISETSNHLAQYINNTTWHNGYYKEEKRRKGYTFISDTKLIKNISSDDALNFKSDNAVFEDNSWNRNGNTWDNPGIVPFINTTDPSSTDFLRPVAGSGFEDIGAYAFKTQGKGTQGKGTLWMTNTWSSSGNTKCDFRIRFTKE